MRGYGIWLLSFLSALSLTGCNQIEKPQSSPMWQNVEPRQTEANPPRQEPPSWGEEQLRIAERQNIVSGRPEGLDWKQIPNKAEVTIISMRAADQVSIYLEQKAWKLAWGIGGVLFVLLVLLLLLGGRTRPSSLQEVTVTSSENHTQLHQAAEAARQAIALAEENRSTVDQLRQEVRSLERNHDQRLQIVEKKAEETRKDLEGAARQFQELARILNDYPDLTT
jgi:hypothetical protein